jgi:ATP-binding cassette subfamily B protein
MSTTSKTLRFYWQNAWHYPHYVIGALLSVPFTILINSIIPPLILANVLARLGAHDFTPHQIWKSFGTELVAYAILALVGGVVAWRVVDFFDWRLEANVERALAQKVFNHLMDQSANFHANHFSGSLVSQSTKLLSAYIRIADTTVYQVMPLAWSLIFTAIILAHRAPLFDVLLIGFALLYISTAFFVSGPSRRMSKAQAGAESRQTGFLADAITNVMAIKSFAGNGYERKRFAEATDDTRSHLIELSRVMRRQQNYFSTVAGSISAMSLTMAVVSVMVFDANVATVFLILNYTAYIVGQLFQFSNNSLRTYNRALGDASDMTEILQLEPEVQDVPKPEKVRIKQGAIVFKDVKFTHDGANEEPIFTDLNLTIAPGEKVGLVGHSGSGKTTFTRLLLRFSDIDSGEILIDGQNIAHITQDDLHQHIAYVPQEPLLFHRSIRENIAYGKPGATEKEIIAAARKANAHEFIEKLPGGYDTLVGERGVKLSGGQRQRVVIARAILKNAPILVLDEATSSLDSESEVLIQAALQELMKKSTAIVIAHRLSTIQKMDRIIVLHNGNIVEQGTHNELLKHGGTYAKLWAHQSGGFIEE